MIQNPMILLKLILLIRGDSLWSIAQKFYGNGTKWSVIADANGSSGTIIRIGDVLKIPKMQ